MNPIRNSFYLNLQTLKNVSKINYQSVRYSLKHKIKEPFRKPVWSPMAPSKFYRIKKKEILSPEETAQREHMEYTYKINMYSIKEFLKNEFYLPTLSAGGRLTEDLLKEEEQQQLLIEQNNKENEYVAEVREKRLKEFKADKYAKYIAKQIQIDEENRIKGLQLDELVRKEIENSKTFITKENLEERIQKVLNSVTEY